LGSGKLELKNTNAMIVGGIFGLKVAEVSFMPKWRLHNKIASEVGIPEDLATKVNCIIDIEGIHDGREIPKVLLNDARKSYEIGGYDGLRTFFLHHILDRFAQKLLGEAYREVWDKTPRSEKYILKTTLNDANDWINSLKGFEHIGKAKEALGEVTAYIEREYKKVMASIVSEFGDEKI